MDLIIASTFVDTPPRLGFSTNVKMDLTAEQRARFLSQGISLTRTIPFTQNLREMRIIALDIPSGALGSVHISATDLMRAIQ